MKYSYLFSAHQQKQLQKFIIARGENYDTFVDEFNTFNTNKEEEEKVSKSGELFIKILRNFEPPSYARYSSMAVWTRLENALETFFPDFKKMTLEDVSKGIEDAGGIKSLRKKTTIGTKSADLLNDILNIIK